MTVEVKRAGRTARYWDSRRYKASLGILSSEKKVRVSFFLNSKGGGDTQVQVEIDGDSFEGLASQMFKANPSAAVKAFGKVLSQDMTISSV